MSSPLVKVQNDGNTFKAESEESLYTCIQKEENQVNESKEILYSCIDEEDDQVDEQIIDDEEDIKELDVDVEMFGPLKGLWEPWFNEDKIKPMDVDVEIDGKLKGIWKP